MNQQQMDQIGNQTLETLDKSVLIRAAALALMLDQEVGFTMAGVPTAQFVAASRKTWKAHGFNFSDTEIRAIHHELRHLVRARVMEQQRQPPATEVVQ